MSVAVIFASISDAFQLFDDRSVAVTYKDGGGTETGIVRYNYRGFVELAVDGMRRSIRLEDVEQIEPL